MMMPVYLRGNELPVEVEDLGYGVGQIVCLECGGEGDAGKFFGDQVVALAGSSRCVDCKGTGTLLIGL